MSPDRSLFALLRLGVAGFVALGLLASCTSDGELGSNLDGENLGEAAENVDTGELAEQAGDVADGAGENLPDVDIDVNVGAEEEPPPEDEGFSDEDWILIVLLGIAALAIVIGATSAASKHSDKKKSAKADLNRQLGSIVGGTRWLADSGAIELVGISSPQQLQATWNGVRERSIDLESQIASLSGSVDPGLSQSLTNLGQSVAGVRSSMRSYVTVRSDADGAASDAAVQSAADAVTRRCQQLRIDLGPIEQAMR